MLFGVEILFKLQETALTIACIIRIFTVNENISVWKEGDWILLRISDCFWISGWQNLAEKPLTIILYTAWRTGNGSCSAPKNRSLNERQPHSWEPWGPHSLGERAHVVPSRRAPNWPMSMGYVARRTLPEPVVDQEPQGSSGFILETLLKKIQA